MPNEDELIDEEEPTTPDSETAESETEDADEQDEQPDVTTLQAEIEQLRTRLSEVNNESASRRVELKQLQQEKRARELAEMGDVERLQAELNDLKSQLTASETQASELEALNTAVQSQVDALLKELNVPKHITDLIDPLPPAKKLEYLTKNRKAFENKPKRKPNYDAGGSGGGAGSSKKERRKTITSQKRASKRYNAI